MIVDADATWRGEQMIRSTVSNGDDPGSEVVPCDLAQVVSDLHETLSHLDGHTVSFGWRGGQTACFTVAGVQIVLTESTGPGGAPCIAVAVASATTDTDCEGTCSSVIEHLQRRYPLIPILKGKDARQPATRSTTSAARARAATARARGGAYFAARTSAASLFPRIVDDAQPALPDPNCARLRSAFTQTDPEPAARMSTPLRLSTHLLNASLIMVWAPLGAGVMAYALVKGEDARFSGRMVVLTGLFAAAFNTPFGQYMSAITGV